MQNFTDKIHELSTSSVRQLIKTMRYQIKILGTDITVESYSKDNKYRNVLGASFNTRNEVEGGKSFKAERIIINKVGTHPKATAQSDPIRVHHYEDILKVGDTIRFRQLGLSYAFKVEDVSVIGLKPYLLYIYELVGLPEEENVSI